MPSATPAPILYACPQVLPLPLPSPAPYVEHAATSQSPEHAAALKLEHILLAAALPTDGTAVMVTPPFGAETVTPKF